jgi:Domain of unknown function (DUF6484)
VSDNMDQPVAELWQSAEIGCESFHGTPENERGSYRQNDSDLHATGGLHQCATVGLLWAFDEQGSPLVAFSGVSEGKPLLARSVVPLDNSAVGCQVVLLFEQGDHEKPLIMGVLRPPRQTPITTTIDGEKMVFTAQKEIVLRCGEASITLTRSGKVLIHGAYVLTKSAGMNRIKGAAVQIN